MRRIILLLGLCVSVSWLYAGNGMTVKFPKLPTFSIQKAPIGVANEKKGIGALKSSSIIQEVKANNEVPQTRANTVTMQQLDSVLIYNEDGSLYGKTMYKYDPKKSYFTKEMVQFLWNEAEGTWDAIVEIFSDINEDGIVTYYEKYDYQNQDGEKKEWTLNDKGQIETFTAYSRKPSYTTPIERHEFKYDEAGNPIEDLVYQYDGEQGDFVLLEKAIGEYNERNQKINSEVYFNDGGTWVGVQKQELDYYIPEEGVVLEEDLNTSFRDYVWDYENGQGWILDRWIEQEFVMGKLLTQIQYQKNYETGEWTGYPNEEWGPWTNITRYTYDDQMRQVEEKFSRLMYPEKEGDARYKLCTTIKYEYTALDNNRTESMKKFYTSVDGEEVADADYDQYVRKRYSNDKDLEEYDYLIEEKKHGDQWRLVSYDTVRYNAAGSIVEEYRYYWGSEGYIPGENLGSHEKALVTYDNNNKPLTYNSYKAEGDVVDTQWIPFSEFIYRNSENGVRMSTHATKYFTYDGKNFKTGDPYVETDEEIQMDFSITKDMLIYPESDYGYNYKALEYETKYPIFKWDDDTSQEYVEFVYYKSKFHYSDQEVETTGINEASNNNSLVVYPNPAVDLITVNVEGDADITIYSLQGTKLLQTTQKEINISNFAPGCYIVVANGVQTKVVKK